MKQKIKWVNLTTQVKLLNELLEDFTAQKFSVKRFNGDVILISDNGGFPLFTGSKSKCYAYIGALMDGIKLERFNTSSTIK